ncbi:hypothetical protein AgCh_007576 [Apium graveolens]
MTSNMSLLSNVKLAPEQYTIRLPTGDSVLISHIGDRTLNNGLKLLGGLYVPTFHHNLLSIHKLSKDNACIVMFLPDKCVIQNAQSNNVQGVGILKNGLYFLVNGAVKECHNSAYKANGCDQLQKTYEFWHNRLGHAPAAKIKLISQLKSLLNFEGSKVYLTCPMARFTNLSFPLSSSHAEQMFDLIHAATWGPYRASYLEPLPMQMPTGTCTDWDDIYIPQSSTITTFASPSDNFDFSIIVTADVQSQQLRKSARLRKTPAWMEDYAFNCVQQDVCVKCQHWVDVMNCELEALERNDRFKSRLVILGCKQKGVDYGETFAPVAKMATVRTLLAVAAVQNWITIQMDVTNAFLHGDLEEEVYMCFPQGYTSMGSRIGASTLVVPVGSGHRIVCKLIKSLYGLKQAPRCWFSKLTNTLKKDGYVQSRGDYSLLTKVEHNKITLVLVYVDDLLIAGDSAAHIDGLKLLLSKNFHMKDLANVNYFLGLEVYRSSDGFFLSQKKYVMDLLKEYHMVGVKPSKLPMQTKVKLRPDKGEPLLDQQPYQRLLGKLIYLTVTRPDIVYPVHLLTQYMQAPTSDHMQAAKKLLRYLASNPGQGIILSSQSATQLTAYCDSDWASCEFSRKSTSGQCILLGASPISWKTKKQSVVARSSARPSIVP